MEIQSQRVSHRYILRETKHNTEQYNWNTQEEKMTKNLDFSILL